jgi:hypothetical protein
MEGKERMEVEVEEAAAGLLLADDDGGAAADNADAVKEEAEALRGEEAEEEREMLPAGYWCRTSGPRSGWKRA